MKKISMLALGLFAAASLKTSVSSAQGNVSYKLLYDNPLSFKKLFIDINLLQIDVANPTVWRPGIGVEYTLNQQLYFFAEHDRTVLTLATAHATNSSQTYTEAGGIFSFSSQLKQTNTWIRAKSGRYHYKWKIKATALKQFGVRAGINSFGTYKQSGDYYAYATTNSIFAGVAVTTTRDMLVEIGDRGSFDRSSRGIWYADVMIAPSVAYADATDYAAYAGSASTATPLSFPSFTKVPFGARLGYMKYKNWPLPLREGFEFGMRPGIGNGLFFALKADIAIGFIKGTAPDKAAKSDQ